MTEVRLLEFGSPEHAATLALRTSVMRGPDDPPFFADEIALERNDLHFGIFDDGTLQGSLVLTPLAGGLVQMRQVAVRPELRRRGLGRRLVEAAEVYAREKGFVAIVFYARPEAVAFYQALGYVQEAPWFVEFAVPDQMMAKRMSVKG